MKNFLLKIYKKQQFNPTFLGIFFNCAYLLRKEISENIAFFAQSFSGKLLDIGCGTKPYKRFFNVGEYIGLEYDTEENRQCKNADFFYDGKNLPFEENSFNGVIATQVLEHVPDPDLFLKEIKRVLKKGGLLLLSMPLIYNEHEKPFDFFRFTSFGTEKLLGDNNFEIIELRKLNKSVKVLFHLLNCYISQNFKNVYVNYFFISIFNITGILLDKILPKDNDLYSDIMVLAEKK
jgi:SAM-dependent methyltransferase